MLVFYSRKSSKPWENTVTSWVLLVFILCFKWAWWEDCTCKSLLTGISGHPCGFWLMVWREEGNGGGVGRSQFRDGSLGWQWFSKTSVGDSVGDQLISALKFSGMTSGNHEVHISRVTLVLYYVKSHSPCWKLNICCFFVPCSQD